MIVLIQIVIAVIIGEVEEKRRKERDTHLHQIVMIQIQTESITNPVEVIQEVVPDHEIILVEAIQDPKIVHIEADPGQKKDLIEVVPDPKKDLTKVDPGQKKDLIGAVLDQEIEFIEVYLALENILVEEDLVLILVAENMFPDIIPDQSDTNHDLEVNLLDQVHRVIHALIIQENHDDQDQNLIHHIGKSYQVYRILK